MAIANESMSANTPLQQALAAGVASISENQEVTFTQYTRSTIPTDGYVFWVATGVKESFKGSLHYISDKRQEEDETVAANNFLFTATQEVTALNAVNPSTMWVGSWSVDGTTLRVVFSDHGSFYDQAGLWHYSGYAVYPALASQLVDSAASLPTGPIVSNSLPLWLAQNTFAPVYPSFLVPDNVTPPYIVAHVEPTLTEALGSFPIYQWPGVTQPGSPAPLHDLPSDQLMRDEVRLTLYGFTNQTAIQYYVSLIEYSYNTDDFGFCNSPAIRDEKRTQVEITALAQKKTIEISASYYQSTADAVARRLILSSSVATTAIAPIDNITGNNSPVAYTVGTYSAQLQSDDGRNLITSVITSMYRTDWQGRQLLYPTPRTNDVIYSSDISQTSWITISGGTKTPQSPITIGNQTFIPALIASAGSISNRTDTSISGGISAGASRGSYVLFRSGTSGKCRITIRDITAGVETHIDGNIGSLSVSLQNAGTVSNLTQNQLVDGTWIVTFILTPVTTSVNVLFGVGPYSSVVGEDVELIGAMFTDVGLVGAFISTTTVPVTVTDYINNGNGTVTLGQATSSGDVYTWSGNGTAYSNTLHF